MTVTATLDRPLEGRHSASGLIHSLSDTVPPDRLVAPLRPRLWRSDSRRAPISRAKRFGARYELVLSDLWGYPADGWAGRGPPWANLVAWARFVRATARAHRGERLAWDVWNEPDGNVYWTGGFTRFLRVYEVAWRALRDELGAGAAIGGPSLSRYDRPGLEAFLRYCRRTGCDADFLSWHENLQPDTPIETIGDDLREARALAGGRELQVNESVGMADQYRPGETVGYLAALEGGGADYAARSCWPDSQGQSNCRPGALDGLLAPGGAPRAAWWVYRAYAAGAEARVESKSDDPRVEALASGGLPARVLLGRVDRKPSRALDVDVALAGLPEGRLRATVERFPDAGEAPLRRPERLSDREVDVRQGRALVRVGGLRRHEAALVTLSRPG